jgi:hypothetical protein
MALSVYDSTPTSNNLTLTGVNDSSYTINGNQLADGTFSPNVTGDGTVATWDTSGGGNTLAATNTTYTDPYAQYGGQENYNNLLSGYTGQVNTLYDTLGNSASSEGTGYNYSIQDWLRGVAGQQDAINEQGIQNELAKKQGMGGILDMVGRGIRSGNVMLSNKNAADSSAAEALARAYGNIGQREGGKVMNQYEQQNRGIGIAQNKLDEDIEYGVEKLQASKTMKINSLVSDAQQRIAAIDAAMAGDNISMSDRLDLEAEKARIKSVVTGELSKYDSALTQGANEINPSSIEARRQEAFGLANAGTAAANPYFDFTTQVPAQFQNTGPFASGLPLFTIPRSRTKE